MKFYNIILLQLIAGLLFFVTYPTLALSGPMRIVLLPGYVESGEDIYYDKEVMDHYRRTMRFINNQLVKHGYEVINPTAKELSEKNRIDLVNRSQSAAKSICSVLTEKYETDAAYIIWLDIFAKRTPDGYCEVQARIEGEGYDAIGRDLGAGLAKDFTTVREGCIEAVELAEKEIGSLVGRKLTASGH